MEKPMKRRWVRPSLGALPVQETHSGPIDSFIEAQDQHSGEHTHNSNRSGHAS